MTLQDKYPTLEQSKRIAELLGEGALESGAMWHESDFGTRKQWEILFYPKCFDSDVSAYDLAELGEMIVNHVVCHAPESVYSELQVHTLGWIYYAQIGCHWVLFDYDKADTIDVFPTEAQARAALLIHLLSTNIKE